MSLSVIYGRTHLSAFKEACLLLKKQDKLQPVYVVVPDHATLLTENALIDALGSCGLFSVDVITLNSLARIVLGNRCDSSVSSVGLLAIIKKILLENTEKLKLFGRIATEAGFAAEIYKTILQIKACNITPLALRAAGASLSKGLQAKIEDIALVYEEYEKSLNGDIFDGLSKFSEVVKQIKFCDKFKNAKFIFARHETITAQTANIINELVRISSGVLITTVGGKNLPNAAIYPNILGSMFENFALSYAKENGDPFIDALYSFCTNKINSAGRFELYEHKTIEDELCFVAQEICKQLKNGAKHEDFCIAVGNLERYEDSIKQVFARYNIPINIDEKYNVANHSMAKLLLYFCDICKSDFAAQDVLKFAKCGALEADAAELADFENYIAAHGITQGMFLNMAFKNENAAKVQNKLLKICHEPYCNFNKQKTAGDYAHVLCGLLDEMPATDELAQTVKEKLKKLLAEISLTIGNSNMPCVHFVSVLKTAINEVKIATVPVYKNAINVADAFKGFFGEVKMQFVVGACEADFPQTQSDVGIINDNEIDAFKSKFNLAPKIADINKKNLFKTFELCFVSQKTVFSYAKEGAGRPSLIMLNLANVLGKKIEQAAPVFNIYSRQQAQLVLWRGIKECRQGLRPQNEDEIAALASVFDINNAGVFWDFPSHLKNASKPEFSTISPSRLTTYAACPFKYFLTYDIKARQNEKAEMRALDIGSFLHAFCEQFVQQHLNGRTPSPKKLMLEIARSKDFAEAFERSENALLVYYLTENEAPVLAEKLLRHLDGSEFKPTLFEEGFEFKLNNKIAIKGKIDRLDICGDDARIIDYKTGSKQFKLKDVFFGADFQLAAYSEAVKKYHKRPVGAFYMPLRSKIGEKESGCMLSGIMLNDLNVACKMDLSLSANSKSSLIKGLKLKKDGNFDARSPVVSEKEMASVLNYSKQQASLFAAEIASGYIEPSSADNGRSACEFCDFCEVFCSKIAKKRNTKQSISIDHFIQQEAENV